MTEFSLVIPCYNEGANLPDLVHAVAHAVPPDLSMEVIFVDNGSNDDTATLLPRLVAGYPFARVTTVAVNQGYGFGILHGLRESVGATIGWTHADLQTDPADAVHAYRSHAASLKTGATIVKGRRLARPVVDRVFTGSMSLFASAALGYRFSDINAQPKIFSRQLLPELARSPHDFSLDLFLLWLGHRHGLSIVEHPVTFGKRTRGEAKGGGSIKLKWKLSRRSITFILALRRDIHSGRFS